MKKEYLNTLGESGVYNDPIRTFPNGFQSWAGTHTEIVRGMQHEITNWRDDGEEEEGEKALSEALKHSEEDSVEFAQIAMKWTDEFEELHKDTDWDEEDFMWEASQFLSNKLNS